MEQLVIAPPPGSFGALLRACRHRVCLSQEQLAARAGVSERTVHNLEAGRVRSPRNDTVRLLADALQLGGPERGNWFAAARGVNHQRAGPAAPRSGGPAGAAATPSLIAESMHPTTTATGTHGRTVIPRRNSHAASAGCDQGGHRAPPLVGVAWGCMAGVGPRRLPHP